VPDVLAPGLRVLFCGINPGRASSAAGHHFANPRNDFWRLLHAAGFTSRMLEPSEQELLLEDGCGVTNAAHRTTPGSGDLRRSDFEGAAERLEEIARTLRPAWIGFVGKEAYRGAFGERPELGLQERRLEDTQLFVLPSTSPANAAVPWKERLRLFEELAALSEPVDRPAARALVLDAHDRVLLLRFGHPGGSTFWATPGGALDAGESDEEALRRELNEEIGLSAADLGPCVWVREHIFFWHRVVRQTERIYLVRVQAHEPQPVVELREEGVVDQCWWTLEELERSQEVFAPRRLATFLRGLVEQGSPREPIDVGR
jgi:TDG/mug DNA glycosylase family protein